MANYFSTMLYKCWCIISISQKYILAANTSSYVPIGGLFDERSSSGGFVSQVTENVFRYAIWRLNQQSRGRKFAYDIQTVPADDTVQTANKGINLCF